jgi:hypothetical protein
MDVPDRPTAQTSLAEEPQTPDKKSTVLLATVFHAVPFQRSTVLEDAVPPTAHTSKADVPHSPLMGSVVPPGTATQLPVPVQCSSVPPSPAAHTSLELLPHNARSVTPVPLGTAVQRTPL